VYLFDKNNQSVGEVTTGLFVSTELPPNNSGTFDVDLDPSVLSGSSGTGEHGIGKIFAPGQEAQVSGGNLYFMLIPLLASS
jgi:hypothetical protein